MFVNGFLMDGFCEILFFRLVVVCLFEVVGGYVFVFFFLFWKWILGLCEFGGSWLDRK